MFVFSGFPLLVVFTLTHSCRGQSVLIGPSQPIVATLNDDIILPCHLEPAMDVFHMTLEWSRPEQERRFVFVWRDGVELQNKKHVSYEGRTSLFTDQLKHGNISLKLSKVKLSDEGTYRCFVPALTDVNMKLVVGVASSPVVTIAENNTSINTVVLQCESEGWYPEPEVLWLDAEGNLLSAGPTETVRGPDDLYTVSSRVTVEKRHSNRYTCRVQQRNINQTRETQIYVPDDFFLVRSDSNSSSGSSVPLIVGLIVGIMFILAAVLVMWKWRKNKHGKKKQHTDEESQRRREDNCGSNESEMKPRMGMTTDRGCLTTETVENQNVMESTQTENNLHTEETEEMNESEDGETEDQSSERQTLSDVDMEMEKLMKILKTKERGEKKFEEKVSRSMGQIKEKEKRLNEIGKQLEEVEKQREETERKLQSVNRKEEKMDPETQKEAAEKEKDQDVKDLFTALNELERKKTDLQKHMEKTETAMTRIKKTFNFSTENKMKATSEKDKIVKKIEELEKQKNENLQSASASSLISGDNTYDSDESL